MNRHHSSPQISPPRVCQSEKSPAQNYSYASLTFNCNDYAPLCFKRKPQIIPPLALFCTMASGRISVVSLVVLLAVASAAAKEAVVTLDAANFDDYVKDKDFMVVEFYAPWWVFYAHSGRFFLRLLLHC